MPPTGYELELKPNVTDLGLREKVVGEKESGSRAAAGKAIR